MTRRVAFGGVIMDLLPGWMDTTDTTGGEHPFTFTRPDGFGAFQLSLALYRSGPVPAPTTSVLVELLDERADGHGLGESFDRSTDEEPLRVAALSYRSDGDFIRMWYVSDGASFAFATYVRQLDLKIPHDDFAEVSDCEVMVRSIVFS
jgi:hypothetical protein